MTDRQLLYMATFLRALATGMIGVLLGIYLAKLDFDPTQIGIVVGIGLAGAALSALFATYYSEKMGRRRWLIGLAVLSAVGGIVVAFSSHFFILAGAAFLGMMNGMGRDRGASLVIEQAIMPSLAQDKARTKLFAWYNVNQDAGHALGSLLGGLPTWLGYLFGMQNLEGLRYSVAAYAVLMAGTILIYSQLSKAIEVPVQQERVKLSPESKKILWKISMLFSMDSLGGGFLTTALVSYFFYVRFGVSEEIIGLLWFGARVANALSHLGAAWLAKRIGLVNTMVFTHIPSSFLLVTVAYAPTFLIAAILFLLREGLVEMDVPTRQSYLMAVVKPEERTIASGLTSLVRLSMWAIAPSFAGMFMSGVTMAAPLYIGAGLKISYDLMLYRVFRHIKPPEERKTT